MDQGGGRDTPSGLEWGGWEWPGRGKGQVVEAGAGLRAVRFVLCMAAEDSGCLPWCARSCSQTGHRHRVELGVDAGI